MCSIRSLLTAATIALTLVSSATPAVGQTSGAAGPAASMRPTPDVRMRSGRSFRGRISPAFDTDTYTFDARIGEGVQLRLADTGPTTLSPAMTVYSPDGSVLTSAWALDVAAIAFAAPVSGVYTLVVSDSASGGPADTGPYELHYVRAPGANENGVLANGDSVSGRVGLGDLDSYTFGAQLGEGVQLRLADTGATGLAPAMTVYNPDGSLLTSAWAVDVAALAFAAPVSGVYTLVVSDSGSGGYANTGPYEVHYVRTPGANENGLLANGEAVSGQIDLGDLDSYTFDAQLGEGVQLRLADTGATGLAPAMTVYNPDGSLLTSAWAVDVAALAFAAPVTGVYTLVVSDSGSGGYANTGPYEVHYVRAPGANENGLLANGGAVNGQIDLGDLDSYTFEAQLGEGVQLRLADTGATGLAPAMTVYNPDGSLLTSAWAVDVAALAFAAPVSGVYTLVVSDGGSGGYANTGPYEVHYVRAPGASENGMLANGEVVGDQIDLGDLDSYTFDALLGERIELRVTDTGATALAPAMAVYNPDGSLLTSAWGLDVAALNFTAPATGIYTLVVSDGGSGGYANTGAYDLLYVQL